MDITVVLQVWWLICMAQFPIWVEPEEQTDPACGDVKTHREKTLKISLNTFFFASENNFVRWKQTEFVDKQGFLSWKAKILNCSKYKLKPQDSLKSKLLTRLGACFCPEHFCSVQIMCYRFNKKAANGFARIRNWVKGPIARKPLLMLLSPCAQFCPQSCVNTASAGAHTTQISY